MAIHSTYFQDKKLYSISTGKNFGFSDFNKFKRSYENLPGDATHLELDMQKTNYIDSSALGMMLLMNENVRAQISRIDIINANPGVEKIFKISHFKIIFNITAS